MFLYERRDLEGVLELDNMRICMLLVLHRQYQPTPADLVVLTSSFDRGSCGRLLVAGRLFAVTTASNTTRSASEGLVWSTRHLWVHGLHDDSYHGNDEAERRGSDHLGIPRKGKNMEKLGTSEEEIVLKLCKGDLLLATHAEVEGSNTNKPRILTEPDKPSLKERRTPVGFSI